MNSLLIVDDVPENIDVLVGILESDYTIKATTNGKTALKIAEKTLPDLILLDVMMPEMDGYEVCRRLKASSTTKDIPVVFVTAKNDVGDEYKGFKLGAVDYIGKPISPAIVKARIKTQIKLKNAYENLAKKNQELEELMKLREDMVNMIIHDMRTPLNAILAFCEILKMRGISPEYQRYFSNIETASFRLNEFVDDMLILAKTTQNKMNLNRSVINVNEVIKNAINIHSSVAEVKGIRLLSHCNSSETVDLSVDAKLFGRVIDNLLSNALKFSAHEDIVSIKIEKLDANNVSHNVKIKISDQGVGISDCQKSQIFKKFTTFSVKENIPQIGLGLSFCKLIIELHGGIISVEDNDPKGSIFTIML